MDEVVLPIFYIVDTLSEIIDKEKNIIKSSSVGKKKKYNKK